MPSDPRKLKPSELCRLLNSTPLGEVISERQLYRHRQRAGARIGDHKTVDLLRYCAGNEHYFRNLFWQMSTLQRTDCSPLGDVVQNF